MENNITKKYTVADYKSDQYVRWCPGCGDHAVLNSLYKSMEENGVPPHEIAVISGIGCSSRLPYYVNTYGFHTIHGRGAAVASGVKTANPDLQVWLVTGDGDCLAIGGNHFIHTVRRNVNINILLLNNKIYGLTKGQFSPTSARGFKSKTSPQGTIEEPFNPIELAFGARCTFFARGVDTDLENTKIILSEATKHQGTSVVEILQNCVIFNNNIDHQYSTKANRLENAILLQHGEKMVFGVENEKGIVLDGLYVKVVTLNEDGYTLDDVLVHDAYAKDTILQLQLGTMHLKEGFPLALGVIRAVQAPTYDQELKASVEIEKSKHKEKTLKDYLMTKNYWEVK